MMNKKTSKREQIAVVINPASGQDYPILATLNRFFNKYKADWNVLITKNEEERFDFKDYDRIVVYGGDGTFTEIARQAKRKPLLLLQGGTANTIAKDLGIPKDVKKALQLLNKGRTKKIDAMLVNGKEYYFKVATGSYIKEYQDISRSEKDKMGYLAYVLKLIEDASNSRQINLKISTKKAKKKVKCQLLVISNNASFGIKGLKVHPKISPFDGKLDLLLMRNTNIISLSEIAFSSIMNKSPISIHHENLEEITVESDKKLLWLLDEEFYKLDKVKIKVKPENLQVIVPK